MSVAKPIVAGMLSGGKNLGSKTQRFPRKTSKSNHQPKRSKQSTILSLITHNVNILFDIFKLYGYRAHPGDIDKTIERYSQLVKACKGDWLQLFKYKLSSFFAVWTKCEPSKQPFNGVDSPRYIACGAASRWLCLVLGKLESKNKEEKLRSWSLLTSIHNAKKGFEKPNAQMLKAEAKAFFEDLTKPQEDDTYLEKEVQTLTGRKITVRVEDVKEQIRRTVEEIFQPRQEALNRRKSAWRARDMRARMTKAFFPSTSANYIDSRDDAGSVSSILDEDLIDMIRRPGGYLHEKDRRFEDDERSAEDAPYSHHTSQFQRATTELMDRCLYLATKEPNRAVPVPLAEALKIRVITKMPPFKMYVLKFLQKEMLSELRDIKQFGLVGAPTGDKDKSFSDYLEDVLGFNTKGPLFEGSGDLSERLDWGYSSPELIISGDYKAATNNFKSWASEIAANTICDVMHYPDQVRELFVESLTRYEIELDGVSAKQQKGQLMGSVVSFPILCIVNAAICRYAHELGSQTTVPLREMSMCVNGDDVALRTDCEGLQVWRGIVDLVGLQESVGKTYFSRNFMQINSQNFLIHKEKLTSVPFVNMGLVTGQKRSGNKANLFNQADEFSTIGSRYRDLMSKAPTEIREEVHRLFVREHTEVLHSTMLPWFIPEWLGGLGLTGHRTPSDKDLRISHRILLNWSKARPKPIWGCATKWKVWELAAKRVPKPFQVRTRDAGVERYEDLMHQESLNLLLDSNIQFKDIFSAEGERSTIKMRIRANEKLWRVKGAGNLPSALSLEDLEFRRTYDSVTPAKGATKEEIETLRSREEGEWVNPNLDRNGERVNEMMAQIKEGVKLWEGVTLANSTQEPPRKSEEVEVKEEFVDDPDYVGPQRPTPTPPSTGIRKRKPGLAGLLAQRKKNSSPASQRMIYARLIHDWDNSRMH